MVEKILIANRGEIACDLISFFRLKKKKTVLVVSTEDETSLAARIADRVVFSGEGHRIYRDAQKIVKAAQEEKCDSLHPGYGYLASSPELAGLCEERKIMFFGPQASQLERARNRNGILEQAGQLGVRTVEHSGLLYNTSEASPAAVKFGFPLSVIPNFGYLNYGIQYCGKNSEFKDKFLLSQKESFSLLGNQEVYLERYYPGGYTIEVPFAKSGSGSVVIFPEINTSARSHFKKIILESPAPFLDQKKRSRLYEIAMKILAGFDFCSVGSLEFVVTDDFLFSCLNPFIPLGYQLLLKNYGVDFRELQLQIAETGKFEPFSIQEGNYGIESRIYAERWQDNFRPCSGAVQDFSIGFDPLAAGAFFSTPLLPGEMIGIGDYPFLGKLVVSGKIRSEVIEHTCLALDCLFLKGLVNNATFIRNLITSKYFQEGRLTMDFIDQQLKHKQFRKYLEDSETAAQLAAALLEKRNPTAASKKPQARESIWSAMGRLSLMQKRGL
ncbi:MAG: biotin carboxylase N-terminal domain-containing protein [Candidatus Wallbacteria bacterium]|nr:biotin carboxylase N-terminal domain-containing protein [Candidatus Wallbacteria bacterium]